MNVDRLTSPVDCRFFGKPRMSGHCEAPVLLPKPQRILRCQLALYLIMAFSPSAPASDAFATKPEVPPIAGAPMLNGPNADYCKEHPVDSPIALFEAVERALCESPKTRSSWAGIKAAAAGLGMSKSAYLPTIEANGRYLYEHDDTQTLDTPRLHTNYARPVNEETLSLGWVLYDFGARSAAIDNSKALLLAAQANHDATLQAIFANTAKDYFSAQAANASVLSKLRIETASHVNYDSANALVAKGVAPVTDALQAETALAQAVFERARAEGELRKALGALAVDMSVSPDEAISLPELDSGALPDTTFVQAVHDLLEQAKESHPKVVAAAAQWQAALANVHVVRARGLPTLSLVGSTDGSSQPVSASLGQPELPAQTRENYVGVKIEIPLFDGFNRQYQVHQAEAEAEIQEQGMRDTQQQVAISLWTSVQDLQTDTDNLRNTDRVLQSARKAFDAAQHRYQSGVGTIVDLLNAQAMLSTSEQQWIQAQLDWRTVRLHLAASLGTLGMWALE